MNCSVLIAHGKATAIKPTFPKWLRRLAYANFLEDKITGNDRDLTVTETGEIQQRCRELLEKCRET